MIPIGRSNPIGAQAYVDAMKELARQIAERGVVFDRIVVASGSGGTRAGMAVGARAHHLTAKVLGIGVSRRAEDLRQTVGDLAQDTAAHLGLRFSLDHDAVRVNDDYLGAGYGRLGDAEREAIGLGARTEGVLLDPVYTGRAMAGLIDLTRRGDFAARDGPLLAHGRHAGALRLCKSCSAAERGGQVSAEAYTDSINRPAISHE